MLVALDTHEASGAIERVFGSSAPRARPLVIPEKSPLRRSLQVQLVTEQTVAAPLVPPAVCELSHSSGWGAASAIETGDQQLVHTVLVHIDHLELEASAQEPVADLRHAPEDFHRQATESAVGVSALIG